MKASLLSVAAASLALVFSTAHADPTVMSGVYGQYGRTASDTNVGTFGITAPIDWKSSLWGTSVGAYWDLGYSRLPSGIDNNDTTHLLSLKPAFRFRFANGASPWFADAGIGATYTNARYRTADKEFSTRFNFASHIGAGYSFGQRREHELVLRVEHTSNASIKKPNPGENFVQLRYGYTF